MELNCLMRLYWLLRAVFLVVCFALQYLFLCTGDFTLSVCLVLSLIAHCSGLFLFRQVNALDCAPYLGSAARASLAGLTDFIGSDYGLPLSFRSSIILLTNMQHLFLEALCLCSCNLVCCRPRLAHRHIAFM